MISYGEYQGKKDFKLFLKYARARFDLYKEEHRFRLYMAESINLVPDNMKLSVKYSDFIHPKAEDHRTGDEIAFDVIQNLGLRTTQNECI